MPSRLIHVQSSADGQVDARIVLTEHTGTVPYLSLSYCWGGDQKSKTTEKSLLASKGIVNVASLPKTIIDAMIVTVNVGHKYLWVDSICILQDNYQDKANEIAKMPAIYSNAVCSIAASFPSSAREGFLQDRAGYTDRVLALNVRPRIGMAENISTGPEAHPQKVFAFPIDLEDALVVEPLSERGWCLQERLLSTRVLEYRRNQVRFLCPFTGDHDESKNSKSDGWTRDWPSSVGDISFPRGPNSQTPATLLGWDIKNTDEFRKLWYSIVEAYTNRTLAFTADRSLAISGIAQRIANMNKDRPIDSYAAGHWLSECPQDLLWYWRCPDWATNRKHMRRRPTWAWVSVDTEVQFPQKFEEYTQRAAQLIDQRVKLRDSSAPFGDVEQATLTIKGQISTKAICRVTRTEVFPRELRLHDKITDKEVCEPYLDAMTGPEDAEYAEDVILLLIGTSEYSRGSTQYVGSAGLILFEELGGYERRAFSRIGS
jgi:hypothetical protein